MHKLILALFLLLTVEVFSQCAVQVGPPVSNNYFNTASDGVANTIQAGKADLHWKVARDSITGTYQPAIVMTTIPSVYYRSPWPDCNWISFSATGEHTGDKLFFFKTDFDLPCFSPCGKSYNNDNSFCVSLDLFSDNSIYEIYVNGISQSNNLGNIIPLPNPYKADGSRETGRIFASLCKNWKAGNNTLVIQVASSATVAALLAQASVTPLPPVANQTSASICEGSSYTYRNKTLTKAGYYLDTFRSASGCDSVIGLQLSVKPRPSVTIDTNICEGQAYAGHSVSGTYTDVYAAANGCDSIRTLNLTVRKKPTPVLTAPSGICAGDSIRLSPGMYISYLWQDQSANDHYYAKAAGSYSVTVTNACGSGNAQVTITEKECGIYFPSAFTPNKDGRNESFKILTTFIFQDYYLCVYNRWGQKIFETSDPSKAWDGNLKSIPQQTGNYIWYCRFTRNNQTKELNGNLVLIR